MSRRKQHNSMSQSRRDFLWKGACAAMTTTSIATTIRDLRMIRAAAALDLGGGSTSSYKALVCIFLFGGNDGNNVVIPIDGTSSSGRYGNYLAQRQLLAIPQPGATAQVTLSNGSTVTRNIGALPLTTASTTGLYGVHPDLINVASMFNSGNAALLANVGTLLGPITKAQYNSGSKYVPPQLFSHSDQQLEWQTGIEDQAPKTGWGGRSADLLYTMNTDSGGNLAKVSMNISLAGSNTFEAGNIVNTYNVSTGGAVSLSNPSDTATLQTLLGYNHNNLYQAAYSSTMNTAINNASLLGTAIAPTSATNYFTTPFTTSSLGQQLKMIARLIAAAPTLNHQRQIFFADANGFDLHVNEGTYGGLSGGTGAQGNLLSDLDQNMYAFYMATKQLDSAGLGYSVSPNVTQFTVSDFSRTFPMNANNGADHGWGSNHIVVGGAVNGGQIYGTFPDQTVGGNQDTTTGRWIPTTGVEQYSATLANWFGVSSTNMTTVFPYIQRFGGSTVQSAYLGFLPTS